MKLIKPPPDMTLGKGATEILLAYDAPTARVLLKFPAGDVCEVIFSADQAHALGAALIEHAELARGTKAS